MLVLDGLASPEVVIGEREVARALLERRSMGAGL